MKSFRNALLGAALGAVALAAPANATFYVFYSTNGGAYTALNPGGTPDGQTIGSFNFSADGINIQTSSFSNNAPNAAGVVPSYTDNSQFTATNTNPTNSSIQFVMVDNNFQGPTTPVLTLANGITLNQNGSVAGSTLTQVSCVNNTTTVPTTATAGSICGAGSTALSPTANLSTSSQPSSTGSQTTTVGVGSLDSPFTIAEVITLKLTGGANVNAQGNATLSSVTNAPEPASLLVLGSGLVFAGLLRSRRQRNA